MKTEKFFGSMLRAHRLGFRPLGSIGFVRIAAGGPPWQVDVCPFGQLAKATGEHVVWHDDAEFVQMLDAILTRTFKGIAPKQPVTLYLTDEGDLVTEGR